MTDLEFAKLCRQAALVKPLDETPSETERRLCKMLEQAGSRLERLANGQED